MTTTDHLTTAITDVNAQMGRIDTKAAMLLAGSLTAASVGVAIIAKVPLTGPATTTAVLTVATICAAVILLMTAVRPALRGNHGFVRWPQRPPSPPCSPSSSRPTANTRPTKPTN